MSHPTNTYGPLFLPPADPNKSEPEQVSQPATSTEPFDYTSIFSARA